MKSEQQSPPHRKQLRSQMIQIEQTISADCIAYVDVVGKE